MIEVYTCFWQVFKGIKILPTTASVRPFSGADTDYSAREFIGQCEAVMRNASVTEPGDKIAFVKSNLQLGSMACKLMQSSMFWVLMENNDYITFVARFYATFDDMGETNIVRGVTHLVESIQKNSSSQNIFAAQIEATYCHVHAPLRPPSFCLSSRKEWCLSPRGGNS